MMIASGVESIPNVSGSEPCHRLLTPHLEEIDRQIRENESDEIK